MARMPDPEKREEWKRRLLTFDRGQWTVLDFCRRERGSTAAAHPEAIRQYRMEEARYRADAKGARGAYRVPPGRWACVLWRVWISRPQPPRGVGEEVWKAKPHTQKI